MSFRGLLTHGLYFPDLILLILLVALTGPSLWNIVFILGLQYGLGGSRSVRGAVIGIRQNAYIEASQAVGVATPRILYEARVFRTSLHSCWYW